MPLVAATDRPVVLPEVIVVDEGGVVMVASAGRAFVLTVVDAPEASEFPKLPEPIAMTLP